MTTLIRHRPRQWAVGGALLAAAALAAAAAMPALAPDRAGASSHREAPRILGLPQYDTTDVYAFVSPDKPDTTTLIANWIPFEEPAGGPNFYPFATDALYEFNIDNDGDAKADITYRYTFKNNREPSPRDSFTGNGTFLYNNGPVDSLQDNNLLFSQTYTVSRLDRGSWYTLAKNVPVAPSYVGKASMPNYQTLRDAAITPFSRNDWSGTTFAGQAEDSFFLDLRVFDLLYGGDLSEVGTDTLAGFNVNTIAIQVPSKDLVARGGNDPVIGVWTSTSKRNAFGDYSRVSRLGSPLVNEVVIPYHRKDRFNASQPQNDGQFADFVLNPELPKIVEAVYGIKAPATPRNDLVAAFLTGVDGLNKPANVTASEMLRLNTKPFGGQKYSRLGVIGGDNNGFPNGRRLADDVVDIELQVAEGVLLPGAPDAVKSLGDAVNVNDKDFGTTFPYVALPASGSDPRGTAASNSNAGSGATPLTGGTMSDGSANTGTMSDDSDDSVTVPGTGSDGSDTESDEASDLFGVEPTGSTSSSSDEPVTTAVVLGGLGGIVLMVGAWAMWRRRSSGRHAAARVSGSAPSPHEGQG